jgi:hypothetical protein
MKTVIALLLLCCSVALAQEKEENIKAELNLIANIRLQTLYPIQFGNTALSKAHKPDLGFSVQMNLLQYGHFKAGFGIDLANYSITDKEMVANLNSSNYTSSYVFVGYEYEMQPKLRIFPNVGFGAGSLELESRNSRYGKQSGKEFRIGTFVDYKIGRTSYAFAGVHYIHNTFEVETAPEYESFFSKANQIQLTLGVRFGN